MQSQTEPRCIRLGSELQITGLYSEEKQTMNRNGQTQIATAADITSPMTYKSLVLFYSSYDGLLRVEI